MTTKAPSEGKKILVEVELSQLRPDVTCRRCDGERKRANERIEAKRQQGYVYGALQYECNDDVVRLALLERLLSEESQK